MLVGLGRGHAAARGALDEPALDEEGLVNVLNGARFLGAGHGDGLHPHGPAAELVDDEREDLAVHLVQAVRVHVQLVQGVLGQLLVHRGLALHQRVVADAPEQPPGDARGPARPAPDGPGPLLGDLHAQDVCRAQDDAREFLGRVEIQAEHAAEAVAQGRGQKPHARGGADQGEGLQVDFDRARARPLADDQVDLVVLHGGVQNLLDAGGHAVDLVDEQDIVARKIGQDGRQVAHALQHRAGGRDHAHAELRGHDLGQGGLAQAGAAGKQRVVQGLAAFPRRLDEHA